MSCDWLGTTLVKRYETDPALAISLVKAMRCKGFTQTGETVEIRNNIAPNGGGEYLTEEVRAEQQAQQQEASDLPLM
jgi:hypothetical protein